MTRFSFISQQNPLLFWIFLRNEKTHRKWRVLNDLHPKAVHFPLSAQIQSSAAAALPAHCLEARGSCWSRLKKAPKATSARRAFCFQTSAWCFVKNPKNLTAPSTSWIEHVNPCRGQEKLKRHLPAAQIAKPNKQTTFKLTKSSENIGYLHGILVRRLVVFTLWNNQYGSEANREFCFLDNDAVEVNCWQEPVCKHRMAAEEFWLKWSNNKFVFLSLSESQFTMAKKTAIGIDLGTVAELAIFWVLFWIFKDAL